MSQERATSGSSALFTFDDDDSMLVQQQPRYAPQLRAILASVDDAYQDSQVLRVDETESEDEDEKMPLTLKRSLHEIQDKIDDIKTKITDQEYNSICKKLKQHTKLQQVLK